MNINELLKMKKKKKEKDHSLEADRNNLLAFD